MTYKRMAAVLLSILAALSFTFTACGKDGADGSDGVGIAYVYTISNDNGSQTVVLVLTDGNSFKFTVPAPINGSDGEDGANGQDGLDGNDGKDGKDGAGWLSGTGLPDEGLGNDNDLYIDFSTCDVYKKIDGEWKYATNIKGENAVPSEEYVIVTLDYGDGNTQKLTVKKGESVDLPNPERDNFLFKGWYYNSNGSKISVNSLTPITRDMVLVAEWEQIITTLPTENEIYWSAPAVENVYKAYQPFTFTASVNANAVIFVYFPSKTTEVLPDTEYVWGSYSVKTTKTKTEITFSFKNLPADYYSLSIVALVGAKTYRQTIAFEVDKY